MRPHFYFSGWAKPTSAARDPVSSPSVCPPASGGWMARGRIRKPAHPLLLTSLIASVASLVLIAIAIECRGYVLPTAMAQRDCADTFSGMSTSWDAEWYVKIASQGYRYGPGENIIAFFPAYPLAIRAVSMFLRVATPVAALLASNLMFIAATVVAAFYLAARKRSGGTRSNILTIILLCVAPHSLYFRMAYSESMFLLVILTALLLMEKNANPIWVALVIAVGTATRSVGVVLLIPYFMWLNDRWAIVVRASSEAGNRLLPSVRWRTLPAAALLTVLATSGLLAFILFQMWSFHEPFAFAEVQRFWRERSPAPSAWGAIWRVASLEPVWSTFVPHSSCYWGGRQPAEFYINWVFFTPILWSLVLVSMIAGGWAKWLTTRELVLGMLLLVIPYLLQSDRMCMISQGRFVAVIFPAYIVLGRAFQRLPALIVAYIVLILFGLMGVYSIEFCRGYSLY